MKIKTGKSRIGGKKTAGSRKRKNDDDIPDDYNELKVKTEAGLIPDTIFYRATSNSMYIPSITAEMIEDDGKNVTVTAASEDYFKYTRVHQITKSDHAEPDKVLQIIDAVRRRPIIWDQRLLCHQNLTLVRRAWQQLDSELGFDENYSLARRRQIWKSKKDYFAYAFHSDSLHKWVFASAMEFYSPMIGFRTSVCLRPTISTSSDTPSENRFEKLVLANKNIKCTANSKSAVLTFLLKSIHETGMSNSEMMGEHAMKILEIFKQNLKNM